MGDLLIPKFKISSGFDASQVLKSLGQELPFVFDLSNGGNVTEMVKSPATVEAIFHKCVIEVNEEGTLAAAATGASLSGQKERRLCIFIIMKRNIIGSI